MPASITSTYAGIKRLHYAHALKQLRLLVNGVAEPGGGAADHGQPGAAPAAATWRCRCSRPDGCAPIRTWRDARRLGQHRGRGLPGQPGGGGFPAHRRRHGPVALAPGAPASRRTRARARARRARTSPRPPEAAATEERKRTAVYTAQGTIEKSHLLKQHQPMVRRIALQMIAKLPASVELDDLIQAGMIGLLDASTPLRGQPRRAVRDLRQPAHPRRDARRAARQRLGLARPAPVGAQGGEGHPGARAPARPRAHRGRDREGTEDEPGGLPVAAAGDPGLPAAVRRGLRARANPTTPFSTSTRARRASGRAAATTRWSSCSKAASATSWWTRSRRCPSATSCC